MNIGCETDRDYIIGIRRELHMHPEVGFDLPNTIALVKRELDQMGVPHNEKYGKSSVVGTIGKGNHAIGIRADMDALPIGELNQIPYRSQVDGVMHACGHDAHTAMLLGTAKALKRMEDKLKCRVMLLFQPSEEGPASGAKLMVEDGVMDDIDEVIALHVENWLKAGTVGICPGMSMASNRPFALSFFGKSAHATLPQSGRDALAMAVRTYDGIQQMLTREIDPFAKWVCSVGTLHAGKAFNVISDYAKMEGTIRAYDASVDEHIIRRIRQIAQNAADETGGRMELDTQMEYPALYNDPELSERVLAAAEKVIGKANIVPMQLKMSSEDFSYFAAKKPGAFLRLGTRNEEKGYTTLPHNNDFMIDEDAFEIGSRICVQFVLDNMSKG